MKSSKLSIHNVASQMRLDASYHLSDGLLVRSLFSCCPYPTTTISDLSSRIFYGNRDKRVYVANAHHGIPFLSSSDILLSRFSDIKYVSAKYTNNIEDSKLEYGWTLITRSGTVGKTTWSTNLHVGKLSSEHVIRVVPKKDIKAGYLYAFLSSKYGYSLLTQGMFGAVIQSIEPSYIESLPIPVFPKDLQSEIDSLIHQYSTLRENAQKSLEEAVSIFEKEIGNSSFQEGFVVRSISSKNISGRFKRFDSQYQIGLNDIEKEKGVVPTIKLGNISSKILVGNRGKRNYVESNGIPFLSSSEMMLANPTRYCKKISKNSHNIDNLIVHNGDILISRSGTVGNTMYVGNTLDGVAVSEHAMKLCVDKSIMQPEYVFAYLLTQQGQNALHILPYGSVIITLGEEFLANLDIPQIPEEKKEMVVKLIQNYVKQTDDSILKENKAIEMVEQEIEKWNN